MRPPVQIRAQRLPALKALFGKVREFGANPNELLDIWGALLEASTRTRFDTGRGPGGIPWPISQRARRDGGKTLVDKGNLEGSLRYEVRPGELEVGVDGVGASSKHARVHQFGVTFQHPGGTAYLPRANENSLPIFVSNAWASGYRGDALPRTKPHEITIPARPFLGIDGEDKADMKEVAIEHLRSLVGDGGP